MESAKKLQELVTWQDEIIRRLGGPFPELKDNQPYWTQDQGIMLCLRGMIHSWSWLRLSETCRFLRQWALYNRYFPETFPVLGIEPAPAGITHMDAVTCSGSETLIVIPNTVRRFKHQSLFNSYVIKLSPRTVVLDIGLTNMRGVLSDVTTNPIQLIVPSNLQRLNINNVWFYGKPFHATGSQSFPGYSLVTIGGTRKSCFDLRALRNLQTARLVGMPTEAASMYPATLRSLEIYDIWPEQVFPDELEELTFHKLVCKDAEILLPERLKALRIGLYLDDPISYLSLPEHLSVLCLPDTFLIWQDMWFPEHLKVLAIESYKSDLSRLRLPRRIKLLMFSGSFSEDVSNLTLPEGLEILALGSTCNGLKLPSSLRALIFGRMFSSEVVNLRLTEGIRVLGIGADHSDWLLSYLVFPPSMAYVLIDTSNGTFRKGNSLRPQVVPYTRGKHHPCPDVKICSLMYAHHGSAYEGNIFKHLVRYAKTCGK